MNHGTRLLLEEVPLLADVEAGHFPSTGEGASPQTDFLLSFLVGCLVAGALLVTGSSVLNLLG